MHSGVVFSIILLVRLIAIGLRVLLAPSLPELRLPALDNKSARRLYWSLVSVAALVVGAGLFATFLHDVGLSQPLHRLPAPCCLVIATAGIIAVIWSERRSITRLIGVHPADHATAERLGRAICRQLADFRHLHHAGDRGRGFP